MQRCLDASDGTFVRNRHPAPQPDCCRLEMDDVVVIGVVDPAAEDEPTSSAALLWSCCRAGA
jgi:hypothetical protein